MCNTLYEIYPKTVRTEIILEADGTAVPFRAILGNIRGDGQDGEVGVKTWYYEEYYLWVLAINKPFQRQSSLPYRM